MSAPEEHTSSSAGISATPTSHQSVSNTDSNSTVLPTTTRARARNRQSTRGQSDQCRSGVLQTPSMSEFSGMSLPQMTAHTTAHGCGTPSNVTNN